VGDVTTRRFAVIFMTVLQCSRSPGGSREVVDIGDALISCSRGAGALVIGGELPRTEAAHARAHLAGCVAAIDDPEAVAVAAASGAIGRAS
jgi:hypothetical protein